jgi:multisubunit Na+/H+ antiporter MnhE subunit
MKTESSISYGGLIGLITGLFIVGITISLPFGENLTVNDYLSTIIYVIIFLPIFIFIVYKILKKLGSVMENVEKKEDVVSKHLLLL